MSASRGTGIPACVVALLEACSAAGVIHAQTATPAAATATTTTVSASPNPVTLGTSVTITATVTGTGATGKVTFLDGAAQLGTGTLNQGSANFSTSSLSAGNRSLTAAYSGDATHLGSTSAPYTETVNKLPTTTTLTASPNPAGTGQKVTLTATVTSSGGTTGNVTFYDNLSALGSSSLWEGAAVFPISTLSAGTHSLSAVYGGDADNAISSSPAVILTVNQSAATTTALTVSPNPAAFAQSVALTASVTPPTATGTVAFTEGTTSLGSAALSSGTAIFTTSSLAGGLHSLVANYSGDSTNAPSASSAVVLTVNQVTLAVSPNPAAVNQPVTFAATVVPSGATGTVSFRDGASQIGAGTLSNGTATFSTSALAAGSHTLTAAFAGSTSNSVTEVVNKANSSISLSASPTSSASGQPVTFTATVSPASATGTVTFLGGQTTIGSAPLNNGTAVFATANLTAGSHSVTAVYSGDSAFAGSTSAPVQVTVGQGTTATTSTLSASPNPASPGQPVTLTLTVTPASATGTVTFKDGGATIGTATLAGGSATLTISTLTAGSHSLTAS